MQTDILSYDKYLVQFSGGKDSSAVFLYLLEEGVSLNKIELWHQDIDGCGVAFFDWKITRNYCRCFAHAFGVPLYLQWKEGGFQRELLRKNARTAQPASNLRMVRWPAAVGNAVIPEPG